MGQGVAQDHQELVVVEGFLEVLEESDLVDRPDRVLLVGVAGHDDDIGVEVPFDELRQFETPHARQHDVGDNHLNVAADFFQKRQSLFGIRGHDGVVARHLYELVHRIANTVLVINDQYVGIFFC